MRGLLATSVAAGFGHLKTPTLIAAGFGHLKTTTVAAGFGHLKTTTLIAAGFGHLKTTTLIAAGFGHLKTTTLIAAGSPTAIIHESMRHRLTELSLPEKRQQQQQQPELQQHYDRQLQGNTKLPPAIKTKRCYCQQDEQHKQPSRRFIRVAVVDVGCNKASSNSSSLPVARNNDDESFLLAAPHIKYNTSSASVASVDTLKEISGIRLPQSSSQPTTTTNDHHQHQQQYSLINVPARSRTISSSKQDGSFVNSGRLPSRANLTSIQRSQIQFATRVSRLAVRKCSTKQVNPTAMMMPAATTDDGSTRAMMMSAADDSGMSDNRPLPLKAYDLSRDSNKFITNPVGQQLLMIPVGQQLLMNAPPEMLVESGDNNGGAGGPPQSLSSDDSSQAVPLLHAIDDVGSADDDDDDGDDDDSRRQQIIDGDTYTGGHRDRQILSVSLPGNINEVAVGLPGNINEMAVGLPGNINEVAVGQAVGEKWVVCGGQQGDGHCNNSSSLLDCIVYFSSIHDFRIGCTAGTAESAEAASAAKVCWKDHHLGYRKGVKDTFRQQLLFPHHHYDLSAQCYHHSMYGGGGNPVNRRASQVIKSAMRNQVPGMSA
ncbi:hypothetical protein CEUSTIGMA_g1867.t1 [Chlamydomonas eustigma]|uniref:Uncharacterized protein n=1 Tax=Chlamydomonas eustigma TaxID=1157962 RepID=A0A250WUC7_9CHLO|nr:hypothetical protein CEUSTIGMA_g1867.t1 [Chlamydomonas eustigma]|eukprot:GAX74418.1 hypothetical protein CEUSTIGMA_g1867.t1 [Chlamydomonas eustigma]